MPFSSVINGTIKRQVLQWIHPSHVPMLTSTWYIVKVNIYTVMKIPFCNMSDFKKKKLTMSLSSGLELIMTLSYILNEGNTTNMKFSSKFSDLRLRSLTSWL